MVDPRGKTGNEKTPGLSSGWGRFGELGEAKFGEVGEAVHRAEQERAKCGPSGDKSLHTSHSRPRWRRST